MEEEKVNELQRELVRDDTELPRGECESIVYPENPDGDVEVSLRFIDMQHNVNSSEECYTPLIATN